MRLGFSVGALHKTNIKPMSAEAFSLLRDLGCNIIELSIITTQRIASLQKMTRADLAGFEYVSLHAPAGNFVYDNGPAARAVLAVMSNAHRKIHFDAIVIHPDRVKDWTLFETTKLPWAFENMDDRKNYGKTVADMAEVFDRLPARLVLDTQHTYMNDRSMRLAAELQAAFGPKISHVHISGNRPESLHCPLFETGQDEIIQAIVNKQLPIIIEGAVIDPADLGREYDYIKKILNG